MLVTSSENVEFPLLGKEKITLDAFKPEKTFELLKSVWKNSLRGRGKKRRGRGE